MHSTKQIPSLQSIILSLLVTCSAQTAHAKSVYVVTAHYSSIIKAYDIQDDQIQYQATAENLQDQGLGAVGLALDPDSQILFVTYEASNIIEMLNAKTMISEDNPVLVPNASNLAGICIYEDGNGLNKTGNYDIMLYNKIFIRFERAEKWKRNFLM